MEKKSVKLPVIVSAVVLAILLAVLLWTFSGNVLVNGKLYPKNAAFLNLREEALTLEDYAAIREKLPNCELSWSVPLSDGAFAEDSQSLRLSTLTDRDVDSIAYFPQLQLVELEGCSDYPQIAKLRERYPDLEVRYSVILTGEAYPQDTTKVVPTELTDEDIENIQYLPELKQVLAVQCTDKKQVKKLEERYPDLDVATTVTIGGKEYTGSTSQLTASAVTAEEGALLGYLPKLKKVHLTDVVMTAEELVALQSALTGVSVTWEVPVCGVMLMSNATEVELTGVEVDAAALDKGLTYLPQVEQVFLNECILDNEAIAALREEKRSEYKVAWTIDCGMVTIRSDDTYFMPIKLDAEVRDSCLVNFKYCEDMICVDFGHMRGVSHCEWAAYMPNLKYLILAETAVRDLTPLSGLKNLVFLELFMTPIKDYSPLLGCTALEDLNLCYSHGDPEAITQMHWLKRLWWTGDWAARERYGEKLHENLPDTEINFTTHSSTGEGWRKGQNYYDMRDLLEMPYLIG